LPFWFFPLCTLNFYDFPRCCLMYPRSSSKLYHLCRTTPQVAINRSCSIRFHRYEPAWNVRRSLSSRIAAGSSNFLLGAAPLKYPTPTADRDQPVSRMFCFAKPRTNADCTLDFAEFWNFFRITTGMDYTFSLRLVSLTQGKPYELIREADV